MDQEKQQAIRGLLDRFKMPLYNEIPDVGLYLEQAAKFTGEYLAPLPGVTITTSMISNYVKKDLIPNPVKKQYYRDQIVQIFFIAIMKSVLGLEDIGLILKLQEVFADTREAYEYFCQDLEQVMAYVFGLQENLPKVPEDAPEVKLLTRSALMTVAHKIYLEQCFGVLRARSLTNVIPA